MCAAFESPAKSVRGRSKREGDLAVELTVILPVRNAGPYILNALDRLGRPNSTNFEVLVVNDHSTDDTVDLVSRALVPFRLRLISLSNTRGVAAARNEGLANAVGRFVWFADVDDLWSDEFIPRMLGQAKSTHSDVVICRAEQTWGEGRLRRRLPSFRTVGRLEDDVALEALLADTGALWNKVFYRDILGSRPFPLLASKSDHAGIARVAGRVRAVTVIDEVLYTYVARPLSISNGGIVEPENLLQSINILDKSLASRASSPRICCAVRRYRYDIYARVVREIWRFGDRVTSANEVMRYVRSEMRLLEISQVAWRDPISAITCAGAKVAPNLFGRLVVKIGRRIWVAHEPPAGRRDAKSERRS